MLRGLAILTNERVVHNVRSTTLRKTTVVGWRMTKLRQTRMHAIEAHACAPFRLCEMAEAPRNVTEISCLVLQQLPDQSINNECVGRLYSLPVPNYAHLKVREYWPHTTNPGSSTPQKYESTCIVTCARTKTVWSDKPPRILSRVSP